MRWAGPVIWAGLVCRDLGTLKKNNFSFTIRANLTTPVTWDPGIAMQLVTTTVNWILILTNLNIRKREI